MHSPTSPPPVRESGSAAPSSTPTAAQEGAWGDPARAATPLIIVTTGSGKTLEAFLWSLGCLYREHRERATAGTRQPPRGARILYISPLKALGADVGHATWAPLTGITRH